MTWNKLTPGDPETYPPNDAQYWATWKNGRVEMKHFDTDSPFVGLLWQYVTHWAPIVPPTSPNIPVTVTKLDENGKPTGEPVHFTATSVSIEMAPVPPELVDYAKRQMPKGRA